MNRLVEQKKTWQGLSLIWQPWKICIPLFRIDIYCFYSLNECLKLVFKFIYYFFLKEKNLLFLKNKKIIEFLINIGWIYEKEIAIDCTCYFPAFFANKTSHFFCPIIYDTNRFVFFLFVNIFFLNPIKYTYIFTHFIIII